jgi:hypothetical protein
MARTAPLLAQLVEDPITPPHRILLPEREAVKTADLPGLGAWQEMLDRYAQETAGGGTPQHVLDFTVRDRPIKDLLGRAWFLWPQGVYIPGAADYREYWPWPCPDDHRYTWQWVIGNEVNQASAGGGHVWAYTAAGPYTAHAHSEAGIGVVFAPTATLAMYRVTPTLVALGTTRWSILTTYYGGGWIYEWGVLYIAAWEINPVGGSLDLVKPYGVTTIFNRSWLNQGQEPVTSVVPAWSPGPQSTNLLLEGGKSYLVGVVAAVDVTNAWHVPERQWPEDADWRTWCTLDLTVPKIEIDPTVIYQA